MPSPFTSWELLARPRELFQGAEVQINGYKLQFVRFTKKQLRPEPALEVTCTWLFFQPCQDEQDAGFVVTHGSPFLKQMPNVWYFYDDATEEQQSYRLEMALQKGDFARLFFLDEGENLYRGDGLPRVALLVGAGGWGQWIQLSASFEDLPLFRRNTAFCWNDSPDAHQFLVTPASKQWEIIAEQKADASSDCAFARRALDWSWQERNTLFYHWSKGSRAEFEAVLRAAITEQRELWTDSTGYQWVIQLDRFYRPEYPGDWTRLDAPRSPGGFPPAAVRAILRRVVPYFEITYDKELTTRYQEGSRWRYFFNERMIIRIEDPTGHERLEAALFWREWQATHPATN